MHMFICLERIIFLEPIERRHWFSLIKNTTTERSHIVTIFLTRILFPLVDSTTKLCTKQFYCKINLYSIIFYNFFSVIRMHKLSLSIMRSQNRNVYEWLFNAGMTFWKGCAFEVAFKIQLSKKVLDRKLHVWKCFFRKILQHIHNI